MIGEAISAFAVALFSLAAYQDGEPWKSGWLAGITAFWLLNIAFRWLKLSAAPREG